MDIQGYFLPAGKMTQKGELITYYSAKRNLWQMGKLYVKKAYKVNGAVNLLREIVKDEINREQKPLSSTKSYHEQHIQSKTRIIFVQDSASGKWSGSRVIRVFNFKETIPLGGAGGSPQALVVSTDADFM